jgi:hypothetical protein
MSDGPGRSDLGDEAEGYQPYASIAIRESVNPVRIVDLQMMSAFHDITRQDCRLVPLRQSHRPTSTPISKSNGLI